MRYIVAALLGCSLALSTIVRAQHQMKLGEVLIFNVLKAKPESGTVDAGHLFQADRGSRKGQYVQAWTAASRPGSARVSLGQDHIEYHLLSPDKVGKLPDVDVLGIHYIKVRPERREAFERFVSERLHPTVGNLRPDLRLLYYKSVSGADTGHYITLFALTKASRDKYWPGGSDSDDLRAAFTPAVKALTKELSTYLVEGSYLADEKFAAAVYESREWTDFVLVPAAR